MAVLTIIKEIKGIHPHNVALVKMGNFYHVYGKDAYILAFLFKYKIKTIEENCPTCGFPCESINKVMAKLEHEKINYMVLDRRNQYDVDEIVDQKNLNKYEEIYGKSKTYVNLSTRIDKISQKLTNLIGKEEAKTKIQQIEEILKNF